MLPPPITVSKPPRNATLANLKPCHPPKTLPSIMRILKKEKRKNTTNNSHPRRSYYLKMATIKTKQKGQPTPALISNTLSNHCIQYTSANATECAEILLPVSFRHVITGVVTSATRQCFACNSLGSRAGQIGSMDWLEKRVPTSGKRKSNVSLDMRILEESSHASSETCSRSRYASCGLVSLLRRGWMVDRREVVNSSVLDL